MKIVGSLCVKNATGSCAGNTSGTIYATNTTVQSADLAENYISAQKLEPGDVIMPAGDGNTQAIIKTTSGYQSQTIGIISTDPGVTLNSDAATDSGHPYIYPIALQGRVPVKISTENGNIQAGDMLTSSSIPGVAMKATHSGAIIGKALEGYHNADPADVRKIMVFVNLSYNDPTKQAEDDGSLFIVGKQTTGSALLSANMNETTASAFSSNKNSIYLGEVVISMQHQLASMSSQLASFDTLSKQLADAKKQIEISQALEKIGSSSAVLGISDTKTILDQLTVSGRTVLSDVGITGNLSMGLLSINGMDDISGKPAVSINTLSVPLMIQPLATAGVDFMNGKVTIDKKGNVQVQEITAKKVNIDTDDKNAASLGEAILPAGKTTITISSTAVTDKSQIFTSPKTLIDVPLIIKDQDTGKSFTIEIAKPFSKDINFGWWIIN